MLIKMKVNHTKCIHSIIRTQDYYIHPRNTEMT